MTTPDAPCGTGGGDVVGGGGGGIDRKTGGAIFGGGMLSSEGIPGDIRSRVALGWW